MINYEKITLKVNAGLNLLRGSFAYEDTLNAA
jgi:hypothetical protein